MVNYKSIWKEQRDILPRVRKGSEPHGHERRHRRQLELTAAMTGRQKERSIRVKACDTEGVPDARSVVQHTIAQADRRRVQEYHSTSKWPNSGYRSTIPIFK